MDAIDDLLAVGRIAWEPRMHRAVGESFGPRAVPAHTHDACLAGVALLKPFAETERDPLAVGRPARSESSGHPARDLGAVQASAVDLEDPLSVRPIRIHDRDRGVLGFLGDNQFAVPRQHGEHVRVAVVPIGIPAVELLVLGPGFEVDLFVDHRLTVRRPGRRAQHGFETGPPGRGIKPFVRTTLAVIGDVRRAQELREHFQAWTRGVFDPFAGCDVDRDDLRSNRRHQIWPACAPGLLRGHFIEDHPRAVGRPLG